MPENELRGLGFADVFASEIGMTADVIGQHGNALAGVEILEATQPNVETGKKATRNPRSSLRSVHRNRARKTGGELEQIRFLLGHVSVQTIEKY